MNWNTILSCLTASGIKPGYFTRPAPEKTAVGGMNVASNQLAEIQFLALALRVLPGTLRHLPVIERNIRVKDMSTGVKDMSTARAKKTAGHVFIVSAVFRSTTLFLFPGYNTITSGNGKPLKLLA